MTGNGKGRKPGDSGCGNGIARLQVVLMKTAAGGWAYYIKDCQTGKFLSLKGVFISPDNERDRRLGASAAGAAISMAERKMNEMGKPFEWVI